MPLARAFAVATLSLIATSALAQWTDGQSASYVQGQPTFGADSAAAGDQGMSAPFGVAIDYANHKLFVADGGNNRVLRFAYPSGGFAANQQSAEAVLGQSAFGNAGSGLSASEMNAPEGICLDTSGSLYVADSGNNRIMIFDSAASLGNGASANRVLGQVDLLHGGSGTTASTFDKPEGVLVDASGNLWVTDYRNNRVLKFSNVRSKLNGASADVVLGQSSMTSNDGLTVDAAHAQFPSGLAMIGNSLFVSCYASSRILRYDNAASKASGANADGLLGQATFGDSGSAASQSALNQPTGLGSDQGGRLYVCDSSNFRIVIYNDAATKANGANADFVLGQSSFDTGVPAFPPNNASLLLPMGVVADRSSNLLIVGDGADNRVLQFTPSTPLPVTTSRLSVE